MYVYQGIEAHFAILYHHYPQAWICTYGEEMITTISQRQQQQGQMGIAEAFKCLYNI
jgi:hypothetical protein